MSCTVKQAHDSLFRVADSMNSNLPDLPIVFSHESIAQWHCIRFTGWKPGYDGFNLQRAAEWVEIDLDLERAKPVLVAQWFWSNPEDETKNIYVNLPGMERGYYAKGENFNIGTQRFYPDTSLSLRDWVVSEGFFLLLKLIVQYRRERERHSSMVERAPDEGET